MAMAPTITGNALSAPAAAAAATTTGAFAGWLATALFAVLAVATAALALRSLTVVAAGADLVDLAAAIERGVEPEPGYLTPVVGSVDFARDDDDCSDAATRANLTIAWAALTSRGGEALEGAALQAAAMRAAIRRLACNPLDGNAWLRYATIADREGAPPQAIDAALGASHRFAPAEAWVIVPRLEFVTRRFLAGAAIDFDQYDADLQRFVAFEPTGRVADAYVIAPPEVQQRLRPLIDAAPKPRRRDILAAIDRLGVDYLRETP